MQHHQILFATDFSGRDRAVFQSACQLALQWRAKLLVMHVEDSRSPAMSESRRIDTQAEFKHFVPEDVSIDYDHILKTGDAADEVLNFVEATQVDLIVLGTHGRRGMDRVFAGSVAEKIVRKANCAVMTLRESEGEVRQGEMKRILVPVDFSVFGYAALDFASKIAISINAQISIVYVDDSDTSVSHQFPQRHSEWSDHQKDLGDQLKKFKPVSDKIEVTHKLFNGDPAREICGYANENECDLIVLGTHGRTGLRRALVGSVAEQVIRHAKCPVITVKPSNKRSSTLV